MGQSRKLTLTDWTAANNALMQYFEGNKSKLAEHVKMSRTTITNFFNQRPIGESSFRKICLSLRLNPEKVSSTASGSEKTAPTTIDPSSPELDETLIKQVEKRCRQKILSQHSRMRLLSGEEIGVDQLYVDVWLLGKPEHKHFTDSDSLLKSFDIEKDRLALSKRIQRNPGFEIANSKSKLVILGKPGSGKTTFLKHLAIDWCKGKFQPEKISVLIELRRIQDTQWNILCVIDQELGLDNWHKFMELKKGIATLEGKIAVSGKEDQDNSKKLKYLEEQLKSLPLNSFLEEGRLLIFMDGLDEAPTDELRRKVQEQVKELADRYSNKNRFILTCRTQVMEAVPDGFTSVEMADFSPDQARKFVHNWFTANGQSCTETTNLWKTIQCATTKQPDLQELTSTPILLSLICAVLQDSGVIPTNKIKLYKKGINWLLKRWNDEKNIKGWEIGSEAYRQLSIDDKEALFVEISACKFDNPKNFVLFEQDELVQQVEQKLRLVDRQKGMFILKAIEAQHGLLIERADELWSFSHLTFQEYFTFQYLTQLPPQQLAVKIANEQWQTVVGKLVNSQQPADRLLRLLKQAIDQSTASELSVQTFLDWLIQKSESVRTHCKHASIRAFYYSFEADLDLDLAHALEPSIKLTYARPISLDRYANLAFDYSLDRALALTLDRALDRTLALTLDHTLTSALSRALNHATDFDHKLATNLYHLKKALPKSNIGKEIQQWSRMSGSRWIEQLRQVMIEYRNIGHDWQFTEEQKQQLQQYYDANKFLLDLMNIEGAVTEACRAEIEDGLLLPWAELQRRFPQTYGGLEEF